MDGDYDREYASDGVSRYWAHLRRRAGQFRWDGTVTRDPELANRRPDDVGNFGWLHFRPVMT